jgi:hypothetical protein
MRGRRKEIQGIECEVTQNKLPAAEEEISQCAVFPPTLEKQPGGYRCHGAAGREILSTLKPIPHRSLLDLSIPVAG